MYKLTNFVGDNENIEVAQSKGPFSVVEYVRDFSVTPSGASTAYHSELMNIRKRQVICDLSKSGVTCQAGAMQWTLGQVEMTSGVKGLGDLMSKKMRGSMTGESAVKPEYKGTGLLILEPTYKYIALVDLADWNGSIVLEDGMFLACESSVQQKISRRSNLSSAVAGGEGLFNLCLDGNGIVCLESYCPQEELVTVHLKDDELKLDGSFAVAWSSSLNFTVEKSAKSKIGSAMSGEGLVNVYRGTGKVLIAPIT